MYHTVKVTGVGPPFSTAHGTNIIILFDLQFFINNMAIKKNLLSYFAPLQAFKIIL